MFSKSSELFDQAKKLFPGGVNSPVRAFKAVNCDPVFIESAQGAYLHDADNNEYIDYVGSWGPMIAGHGHPSIIQALYETMQKGLSFGACHKGEIKLAQEVMKLMPNFETIRFVNSGTEACMAVIRLARAFTERPKILKFSGCYHGHADSFLVQGGSGIATLGLPDSPGVLPELANQTLTAEFNDLKGVADIFEKYKNQIAAIIVEPVVGNAGCLLPQTGFLSGLRQICDENNSLLIFDEVMTGFRVAKGGAQSLFNVKPDLITLGKILGGGLPVGAYGGRADIMQMIAPSGSVYQAGTLSGNPLGMAAGYANLQLIQAQGFYEKLEMAGRFLEEGLREAAYKARTNIVVNRCGSMISVFFSNLPQINNYTEAKSSDTRQFANFFQNMLADGIYLPPSQFETWFFSSAHTERDLNKTIKVAYQSFFRR